MIRWLNLLGTSTLALAGCAVSNTMMLDDRTALVHVNDQGWGMDLTTKILRTAAEQGRARGFDAFQVMGEDANSRTGVVALPGSTTTNANAICSGSYCSGTAYSTGTPAMLIPITEVRKNVTVRYFHANEVTPDMAGVIYVKSVLGS